MAWRTLIGVVVAVAFVICAGGTVAAAGVERHIRTMSQELRTLVSEGAARSPTFHSLVGRLARSNVLVYLQFDDAADRPHGWLTLMASAGGYRYLMVRLKRVGTREQLIALIGHELQHAVEIADAPSVVDSRSLRMEYQRIGYLTRRFRGPRLSFDTRAANDIGHRVLREIVREDWVADITDTD